MQFGSNDTLTAHPRLECEHLVIAIIDPILVIIHSLNRFAIYIDKRRSFVSDKHWSQLKFTSCSDDKDT